MLQTLDIFWELRIQILIEALSAHIPDSKIVLA